MVLENQYMLDCFFQIPMHDIIVGGWYKKNWYTYRHKNYYVHSMNCMPLLYYVFILVIHACIFFKFIQAVLHSYYLVSQAFNYLLQHHSRSQQRTDQRVLVITLKFLALKKLVLPPQKILSKIYLTFVYLYSMQLFSINPKIFSENF